MNIFKGIHFYFLVLDTIVVKSISSFGSLLSKIYRRIWVKSGARFFDNYLNYLNFFSSPEVIERAIIANILCDYGDNVLDIGCGDGFILELLSKKAKMLFGIDSDLLSLRIAKIRNKGKSNIHLLNSDISDSKRLEKVMNNRFDLVLCFSVIQMLNHQQLKKLFPLIDRVLKSGGKFVASVPISQGDSFSEMIFKDEADARMILDSSGIFQKIFTFNSVWDKSRKECYLIGIKK